MSPTVWPSPAPLSAASRTAFRSRRLTAGSLAPHRTASPTLAAGEHDLELWVDMLDANSRLIRQLAIRRGWASRTILDLGLGFDGARITIPIRDRHGAARGVLRYDPFGRREPKMLAVPGTRLGLLPHPAHEASERVVLVEGPPDMVAARSCGLPAIAVPGTTAWQPAWARLLAGRRVTVVMDCDAPGRRAAGEIAASLRVADIPVEVVDLWPDRNDGYDLTDRILERRGTRAGPRAARTIASLLRPVPPVRPHPNAGACPQQPGGSTMTEIADAGTGDYTSDARRAILQAARDQHDFGGWLAGVLASVSADLGSTYELTAGRPGSWEASLVQQLVKGTVGYDDDYLADYRERLR